MSNLNAHQHVTTAALLRYFLPSSQQDLDLIEELHTTTRPLWIRGRQYLLDVTLDPISFDVLSYQLRAVTREKPMRHRIVA